MIGVHRGKRWLTACLDLARIHRKHQAWTPVQETLLDAVLHHFYYFAGESSELVPSRKFIFYGRMHIDFFKKDRDALNRLIAKRPLGGSQLECITDFVGKVSGLKSFAKSCLMCVIIRGRPKTGLSQINTIWMIGRRELTTFHRYQLLWCLLRYWVRSVEVQKL